MLSSAVLAAWLVFCAPLASAVLPLPAGWHEEPGVAICKGQLLCHGHETTCPPSCLNLSRTPPSHSECMWPLRQSGYADGAYAATQCAGMTGCEAVTCGPAPPMLGDYCAARRQSSDTCKVPGQTYSSFVHLGPGIKPPPPPPPFRLGQIFSDHMVLQRGSAGSAVSGFAPPHAAVRCESGEVTGEEGWGAEATADDQGS